MDTKSVTTPVTTAVESVDRHISSVANRNWLLDALTVSSGAADAVSFLAMGKVFTAFMTGNIAFLGMAIAGQTGPIYGVVPPSIVSLLASLVGFAVGVYIATWIVMPSRQPEAHKGKQPDDVWPQRTTVALGVSLVPHLCFGLLWFAVGGRPDGSYVPILLAVWAVAMGMQSAAVRNLKVEGIFTTAATATYISLAGGLTNISMTGEMRARMRGIVISLFIGATVGAALLIHAPIYAPVLPLVVTAYVVATAARSFRNGNEA